MKYKVLKQWYELGLTNFIFVGGVNVNIPSCVVRLLFCEASQNGKIIQ